MNQTTVVNIKRSPCDVLIDRTTIFGNPFKEWQWGREGCIAKFRAYFYQRIERDLMWKAEVLKLKGKVLGCHCVPLGCHGWIYVEYLEAYDWIERIRKETRQLALSLVFFGGSLKSGSPNFFV